MAVGTLGFVLLIVCMLARLPASDELGALQIVAYTAVVVHVVVVVVLSCFAMVLMGPQFSGVLPSTSNALHESFYARTNVLVYYYTSTLVCCVQQLLQSTSRHRRQRRPLVQLPHNNNNNNNASSSSSRVSGLQWQRSR
jgi:hypothetical protein